MRKILLIGLGVAAATLLLSVITASLMAAPLPSDLTQSPAVTASHHLVRLPDGTIGLLYYNTDVSNDFNVLFLTSTDNGLTWSEPDTLNRFPLPVGVTPYHLMKEPPDVAMASNGDLFAVWDAADGSRGLLTDVFFAFRDHATGIWTPPVTVATGIGEATGPRIAVSSDRALHVVYYDEVVSPSTTSQVWYTRNTTEFAVTGRHAAPAGSPWSAPDTLTSADDGYAQNPTIVAGDDGSVHIFYCLCRDYPSTDFLADQLRYTFSNDNGVAWTSSVEITEHGDSQSTRGVAHPTAVALPDSMVAVAWMDDDSSQLPVVERAVWYRAGRPGQVWPVPEPVTPGELQENLPTLAADSLGRVDLCYEAQPDGVTLRDILHHYKDPGQPWSLTADNLSLSPLFDTTAPGIVAEAPVNGAPARPGFMAAWVEQIADSPRDLFQIAFRLSDDRVWPGDTNNDGTVNADDVLPLVAHWGVSGPVRDNRTVNWTIHPVAPWNPWPVGFADANGDGTVNAHDVIAIGLNWGETHAVTGPSLAPALPSLDPATFSRAAAELRAALGGDAATGHSADMVRVIDQALTVVTGGEGPAAGTGDPAIAARPNPSGGEMRIHYRLASEGPVTVAIFDAAGRRVRTVVSGTRPAGDGEAVWDGRDERGVPAPAGLYLARVEAEGRTFTQKIVRSR